MFASQALVIVAVCHPTNPHAANPCDIARLGWLDEDNHIGVIEGVHWMITSMDNAERALSTLSGLNLTGTYDNL